MTVGATVGSGESVHRYAHRGGEPWAGLAEAVSAGAPCPRVVILGAGAGGLAMAIQLKLAGIESFTVYEQSDGVGGTWRHNSYPGAACDVPSHLYSFSFASKADWSRKFPEQPEILDYFESLVGRFDLESHIEFDTTVESLEYSEEDSTWTIHLVGGRTDTADVVVSALGQLNRPYVPDIPGLAEFEGTVFHSARWDHDHDLRGDRVAVIGIGASAIQFVPPVAREAAELTLFQRTANYVSTKRDRPFRSWEKWLFTHVPFIQRAYRESIYWRFESRFALMKRGSRLGRFFREQFGKQIRPLVSDRLSERALVPDYPPGCRRILIANDWYPTLLKPHVSVVTDDVEKVGTNSVVTRDGVDHVVDTIIFGTGFTTTDFLAPMRVIGRNGLDLNDAWRDGASAYLGLSVPGFPNFFMLYGPNTNLGHNSILFMIEQQVSYILSIMATKARGRVDGVEVRERAMDRWDREIQDLAEKTVWAEDCHSWYKNADGRITNNWVARTTVYRRLLAHPDLGDWELTRVSSPAPSA